MTPENTDEEKLKSLLEYGISHNSEHEEEINEWAKTAKQLNAHQAHDHLIKASEELGKVTDNLAKALKQLNKKEG
ncbi:MAG: hypothetical protein ABEJ25_05215 [Candidatus Bipolaricaulia bacterium]